MNLSTNSASIQEKISEYREVLAFIQSELIADRAKLQQAKDNHASSQEIESIQADIANLEMAIDRTQGQIINLQSQL